MTQTKKIRLVIEADVQQDTELTPDVVARIYGRSHAQRITSEGFAEILEVNKMLLAALLASPPAQQHQLLQKLAAALESLLFKGFEQLADQQPGGGLEGLVSTLSPAAATYFQECIDSGFFFDFAELADRSLSVNLTRIYVEEPQ